MKKIMLLLLIAVASFKAVKAGEETVSPVVLNSFKTEFSNAKNVTWTKTDAFYKAAFTLYDHTVYAFYSLEGDFLGIFRKLSVSQLPLELMRDVHEKMANGYWISDVFEMSSNDGAAFYVQIEDAGTVKILKSVDGKSWTLFNKKKKK